MNSATSVPKNHKTIAKEHIESGNVYRSTEVTRLLGISHNTLDDWCSGENPLPVCRPPKSKNRYFLGDQIIKWMADRSVVPNSQAISESN